jgi:hypothetical protein
MPRVRRTFWSFTGYAAWIAFTLYKVFNPDTLYPYIWLFILSIKLAIVTRLLINRNYFEVIDSKLIIRRDFFYQDTIEINEIEKIELKSGLFSKSRIKLKNQKKELKFRYAFVHDDDFKEFIQSVNVNVV